MPYKIIKNKDKKTFKVINKETKKVYAYSTLNPKALISAIEINKYKKSKFKN